MFFPHAEGGPLILLAAPAESAPGPPLEDEPPPEARNGEKAAPGNILEIESAQGTVFQPHLLPCAPAEGGPLILLAAPAESAPGPPHEDEPPPEARDGERAAPRNVLGIESTQGTVFSPTYSLVLLLEVGHPFYLRLQPNPPLVTASLGSSVGPLTRMYPPLKPEVERGLPLGLF